MRNDPRAPQSFGHYPNENSVVHQGQAVKYPPVHLIHAVPRSSASPNLRSRWFRSRPPTQTGSPTAPTAAQSAHGHMDCDPSRRVPRPPISTISVHSRHHGRRRTLSKTAQPKFLPARCSPSTQASLATTSTAARPGHARRPPFKTARPRSFSSG